MRMIFSATALALATAGGAFAHDFRVGDLVVDHPWASPVVTGQNVGGAFLAIRNEGETADRLVGARTDVADAVEFHAMVETDGVMSMTPLEAVESAPGETVEFAPGGAHFMLIGLNRPLGMNDHFDMTLEFENAGEVEVTFNIETMAMHMAAEAEAPSEDAGGAHMDHGEHDAAAHDGHDDH